MTTEAPLFNYNGLIDEMEDWNRHKLIQHDLQMNLWILFENFKLNLGGNDTTIRAACNDLKTGTWLHELYFPWDEFYQ